MSNKITYCVSSACFFGMHKTNLWNFPTELLGFLNLGEIDSAVKIAKMLDIKIEIVYRSSYKLFKLIIKNDMVESFHAPIFFDFHSAFLQGLRYFSRDKSFFNAIMGYLIFGSLTRDFNKCTDVALKYGAKLIVFHPRELSLFISKGSEILSRKGIDFVIEPDWKRPKRTPYFWIWEKDKIADLSNNIGVGICLDTSHTLISYQKGDIAENLCGTFDFYQKKTKGVYAIHLSAAMPDPENPMRIHDKSLGGMPLDNRFVSDRVIDAFQTFHQHVVSTNYSGSIVIELFSFPEGGSSSQREKAVYTTLETLQARGQKNISISISGKTTMRPL
jgi:sugar phosphate isomerase/epimerase